MSSLNEHVERWRSHQQPRRVDYTREGWSDPRDEPICGDRGPRIGTEGAAICKRPVAHDGPHRPDPDDGWGLISWPRWEDIT